MIMRGNSRRAGAKVPARCRSHREDKLCKARREANVRQGTCGRNLGAAVKRRWWVEFGTPTFICGCALKMLELT